MIERKPPSGSWLETYFCVAMRFDAREARSHDGGTFATTTHRSSFKGTSHTGSSNRAVQRSAQAVMRLAEETVKADKREDAWRKRRTALDQHKREQDEAREQILARKAREAHQKVLEKEALERQQHAQETRAALGRLQEQQQVAAAARERVAQESAQRAQLALARREQNAAR